MHKAALLQTTAPAQGAGWPLVLVQVSQGQRRQLVVVDDAVRGQHLQQAEHVVGDFQKG
jgi:hypothetical protein